MAESTKNKQLGTVYIDTSKLKKNLEEVNQQLASIGKGANLDISKQMEAKLAPIKKQIQEITNAAKEGAKKSSQATDFETRAILVSLESRVKKSQDMAKQREKDEETLQQKLKAMNDRDEAEQKRRVAEQIKAVADANKQITKSYEDENKARAAKEKEVTDELNKIRSEELKQRQTDFKVLLEHKERQAREEVEIEKQMAADADRIREQSLKQRQLDFQALLDQKTRQAEEEIAQEKRVVAEATENYKQQLALQKQLGSMTPEQQANSQQAAVIKQQLKEKKDAFEQYSEAIRQQVYADGSVVNMEEDLARAQAKQKDAQAAQAQAYADRLGERLVGRLGQAEIKLLKDQWSAAVEYASSYYDAMNEIRVVTGKSEQDAERIGASYRKLAKDMKVTSTELSQAAITFYRQGLSDGEVNKRLQAVTKYAKIANIEFETAAELVTSTTNSMGVEVNKVIDVFLMLGDSAATSGEEIGKGMQKAAAAAATFGQDFEWLATYIATVSETLRTAPESIGNAFNTMMARMHSIKQNGFNSEDATTINDVAKALKTVGITLMDQNGNWMELDDIFSGIAEKWGTLNDKQKSYIATTMAGTRQQNVFFALMNDMAKGIEGGSRAWELYEKAINAAGTATEKYATWQESVTASQENMNRALEDLYANLQPTLIKGWYDGVAGFVDTMARGTAVIGGWNIILPALTIGLIAFRGVQIKTTGAATLLNGVMTAMQTHPLIAAVTAFILVAGGIATVIGGIAGGVETAAERYEVATKKIDESSQKIEEYKTLQSDMKEAFDKASSGVKMTASETREYNSVLDKLAQISPEARKAVDDQRAGLIDQAEAAEQLNKELNSIITAYNDLSKTDHAKAYQNNAIPDVVKNYQSSNANPYGTYDSILEDHGGLSGFATYAYNSVKRLLPLNLEEGKLWDLVRTAIETLVEEGIYDSVQDVINLLGKDDETLVALLNEYLSGQLKAADNDFTEIQEAAETFLKEQIGHFVSAFTTAKEGPEAEAIKDNLYSLFLGEDGLLDLSKVLDYDNILKHANVSVDSGQALVYLVKSIFSEETFKKLENELSGAAEQGDFTDAITSFLESLISAGLSNVQIEELLKGISLKDWNWDSLQADMLWEDGDGDFVFPDEDAKRMIERLLSLGVSFEEIKKAANNSKSLEEFKESLKGINETAAEGTGVENKGSVIKYADEIQKLTAEMEKAQTAQDAMKSGKPMSFDDLLDLTNAHPELLQAMTDLETFRKALERLVEQDKKQADQRMKDWVASQEGSAAVFNGYISQNQGRYGIPKQTAEWTYAVASVKTLQELRDLAEEKGDAEMLLAIDNYLNLIIRNGHQATKEITGLVEAVKSKDLLGEINAVMNAWKNGNITRQALGQYMQNTFGNGNVDLTKRKRISAEEMRAAGYSEFEDGSYATLYSRGFAVGDKSKNDQIEYESDKNLYIRATPILPNGKVLTSEELEAYIEEIAGRAGDIKDNDYLGAVIGYDEMGENIDAAIEAGKALDEKQHETQELFYESSASIGEYAEKIRESMELGRAEASGFTDQIGQFQEALKGGNVDEVLNVWNGFTGEMQDAIRQKFPRIITALDDLAMSGDDASQEMKALGKELDSAAFTSSAKTFTNTAKAVDQLYNHEINAADAMAAFNKESELAAKAQYEFDTATENMKNNVAVTSDQVENLAEFIGYINPDIMLDNWDQVGPMLANALQEGRDAAAALQDALFFTITGTSVADFSNIENGIALVGEDAQRLIELLQATGMWDVEYMDLHGWQEYIENGQKKTGELLGKFPVIKPAAGNPMGRNHTNFGKSSSKKTSGGGGGGGSKKNSDNPTSSSSANQMTEVERMLDIMEQIQKIQEHTRSIYEAQAKYYETTGELQGVIAYYELEKKAIADQNATLEANIKDIEAQMYAKQAEVAAMSTSSEAYETAAKDLEKLQSTHQSYTKELLSNKTEMENLTKAIKKQQNTIRDMEIDLRKTIYQAIEDREALIERKLQGRITLENEILDLIQKRYEKERDMILENSQAQIDALESERDLLAEQLQLRREQAEEQDKAAQLAELETQYERIVADPTRRKEALDIQKQIKNLREEMAWDLAEKEVEAQQKSIDDQITSIEDYMEYVRNYYDEMFEHPQKLVAEMESIITQTDEYIIEWLKNNSEEYANVTAARATDMENAWGQMLLDMHGALKLYWDEVESIIEQGDEAIINFLVQNSADYKAAGRLQAQAYVDQWMEMLQKLAQAHKQITAQMAANSYAVIQASTYSGSNNNNSSGSSGSKSSGGSGTASKTVDHYYDFTYHGKHYSQHGFSSMDAAGVAARSKLASLGGTQHDTSSFYYYKEGGLAETTGPAWLDGTKERPERILSPVQTELFESLVRSLETMAKVRIPSLPAFGDDLTAGGNPINVGDIIVNVDKMDNDADYEELAERVFETIMARLNRGSVVGGIRF